MKKTHYTATALFCLLLSVCFTANSQKESEKFSAGFGFEAGLPVGTANTAYHFTGGLGVRLSYHAGPGFITLSSGAFAYVPKSGQGKSTKASLQIPVKAGYKYIFHKPFFVMGEVGYSSFRIYYAGINNTLAHSSSSGFTYAPTVGVNFNAFELGVKYEATSLTGGSLSTFGFRLAFNF
jgi:hypothetical protein